jgi:hypothetical protein
VRRHPGRRATDKPLTLAQIIAPHGGSFTAAQLFTALDGMTRAREALDMVLHETPPPPRLRKI